MCQCIWKEKRHLISICDHVLRLALLILSGHQEPLSPAKRISKPAAVQIWLLFLVISGRVGTISTPKPTRTCACTVNTVLTKCAEWPAKDGASAPVRLKTIL